LRKARPDRLFIEPSGLGHPRTLLRQLSEAPWQGVLAPQPLLLVLDAAALAAGAVLPEAQAEALGAAALLLLNKSEGLDAEARRRVQARLPDIALRWTSQGHLPLAELPCTPVAAASGVEPPAQQAELPLLLSRDAPCVRCMSRTVVRPWLAPARDWRFRRSDVDAWLATLPGLLRAKAVLHCAEGWLACNRVAGDEPWQPSAWRRDNRIELILSTEQDLQRLQDSLLACAQAPN
jgi:G3E family GTPase